MTRGRRGYVGGGLAGDIGASPSSLAEIVGVETVARYRLSLVREGSVPYDTTISYDQPERAAAFLHPLLADYDREVLGALLLTYSYRAIGYTFAYVGTLNQAPAEPRGLLVPALLANAAAIVMFHNHPGGDPTPSRDDLAVTERVVAAGKLLGVTVLDHLILGEPPSYTSLWRSRPW